METGGSTTHLQLWRQIHFSLAANHVWRGWEHHQRVEVSFPGHLLNPDRR
jgi:hypothetical protein